MTRANFRLSNPVHFLALGFGSGLIKPAPGTWGTIAGIPVYLALVSFADVSIWSYVIVTGLAFLLGIYLCGKTAEDVGVHDHGAIVWDEIVGLLVTMIALPLTVSNLLLGFLLFRLFDIFKPWPIRLLDRSVHGGVGIMVDDLLAGAAACLLLHLLQPWLPLW
jgi:phosphatidylglycerophosphatase A